MKKIYLSGKKNKVALVDDEDFDYLNQWKWHLSCGYAETTLTTLKLKWGVRNPRVKMHRVIMGNPKGLDIDHVNHNILDNRKSNLRIVTHRQNIMNQLKRKDNVSGHKGIMWDKAREKWRVFIGVNTKHIFLGRYENIEDALRFRKEAEKKYFGEYALA